MIKIVGAGIIMLSLFSCIEGVPVYRLFKDSTDRKFIKAVIKEDLETIERMIEEGKVDINVQGTDGTTALYISALLEKKKSYVKLLDLGANIYIEQTIHGVLDLIASGLANNGKLFYLEEALEHGLDPNSRIDADEKYAGRPIIYPLGAPRPEADVYMKKVLLLLEYGADPSVIGFITNLVYESARSGYFNVTYHLLENYPEIPYKFQNELARQNNIQWSNTLNKIVEGFVNNKGSSVPLIKVQQYTYPDFLRTIEWLESKGEILRFEKPINNVLKRGKAEGEDYIKHYKVDKDGNVIEE